MCKCGGSGKVINVKKTIKASRTEVERFNTNVLLKYSQCNVIFTMFFIFFIIGANTYIYSVENGYVQYK